MKLKFSIILLLTVSLIHAQSVGVRAGLNFSRFDGPLEAGEKFNIANGFHFGINYGYKITNKFMVRAELQYSQVGTVYEYDGPGHYLIFMPNGREVLELGKNTTVLDISTGHINLPIVAAYQIIPKIEIFGGLNFSFLANPIGRGNIRFESASRPNQIVFRQTLDYRYYQDVARGVPFGQGRPIGIIVDEERVSLSKSAGAYYQHSGKEGNRFNFFDLQVSGGLNYFINRGFFVGGKINYGLLDVSNNQMDRSVSQLNSDKSFILKKDYDRNLVLEASVGFRF
jgi:hypothetical protein